MAFRNILTCRCLVQAKAALTHPWFDDLDREEMDTLENQSVIDDALATVMCDEENEPLNL